MNEARLDQADCLTRTQLAAFARSARTPSPEATHANAHLAACSACRRRLRDEAHGLPGEWERLLASPLAASHCLDIEALLRFVRQRADPFEAESIQMHLEDCRYCRRDAQEMQAFHAEMQEYSLAFLSDTVQPETPIGVPTASTDASGLGLSANPPSPRQSWLEQMRALIVTGLESLRPITPTYAFGTQEEPSPRQTLRFDDPDVSGSYSIEQGKAHVHIEHRRPPPGALLLLEAANAAAEVDWRCFAVCRKGWKAGVVKLEVTPALIQNRHLRLGILQAADLPEGAAETLLASYQSAVVADPAAKKAWQEWGQGALESASERRADGPTGTLDAAIRHALLQIVEGNIAGGTD